MQGYRGMLQVVSKLKVGALVPLGIVKRKGNGRMLLVDINLGMSLTIYILIYAVDYF